MSFKRTVSPTFSAPVTVMVPNTKGGFDKSTFTAVFTRPKAEERAALAELSDADFCRKQLVGWEMVDDDTKEAVPFTPEALEVALSILPTPSATSTAFWQSVNGARTKN
ncbi:MAG: phage tail assembly chaperone [Magnetospirillum sp.]|nr:phage tail assembly chaperone [Magnetospirillum sp.]